MSTAATIAVVVGALVTVLVIAAVVMVTIQRVGRAVGEATRATERLTAATAQLSDHQAVTQRELDRLSSSVETLRTTRDRD